MTEQEFVAEINKNRNIICEVYNTYAVNYSEQDLFQEIILETWKSINNFKKNCKFSTWLYTIARNKCISIMRKQRQMPEIISLEPYHEAIADSSNANEMIKQLRQAIRYNTVLDTIDQAWRSIFEMYLEGISFKEMERQTGINENVLRVNVHRIKRRLQLRYGK